MAEIFGPVIERLSEPLAIALVASGDLSGHRVVTTRDDGTIEYADNATTGRERPLFLTMRAIESGMADAVLIAGEMAEPSWSWIPGEALYLGSNGAMTQIPPSSAGLTLVELGRVVTPTRIVFDPRVLIALA